ncbi:MAG: STAS domain-containing protein [Alphaproteobacteria bacterium]|nr:STAS domain-containing protein [Alphaproteobacteria bacterium]
MDKPNGPARVAFTGSLTVRTADAVRERLLAALAESNRFTIDCSAAEDVDITFIQLVIAARQSAARAGGDLALAQPADGMLLAALRRGGFLTDDCVGTTESTFWTREAT